MSELWCLYIHNDEGNILSFTLVLSLQQFSDSLVSHLQSTLWEDITNFSSWKKSLETVYLIEKFEKRTTTMLISNPE